MDHDEVVSTLRARGIQPSAQRVAVAAYVLDTDEHPSADQVWARTRARAARLSRATVYNTLNLFVARGLLCQVALSEGRVVFDPRVEPHHHFIDETTGRIHDIAWDALSVRRIEALPFKVTSYQVVLKGRTTRRSRLG